MKTLAVLGMLSMMPVTAWAEGTWVLWSRVLLKGGGGDWQIMDATTSQATCLQRLEQAKANAADALRDARMQPDEIPAPPSSIATDPAYSPDTFGGALSRITSRMVSASRGVEDPYVTADKEKAKYELEKYKLQMQQRQQMPERIDYLCLPETVDPRPRGR